MLEASKVQALGLEDKESSSILYPIITSTKEKKKKSG